MVLVALDFMMIGLLCTMIYLGLRLNENIKKFKMTQKEFAPVLNQFNQVISQIDSTTNKIQSSVKEATTSLIPELPKINELKEDMKYLLDHCENTIKRLEDAVSAAKLVKEIKKEKEVNRKENKDPIPFTSKVKQAPILRSTIDENKHVLLNLRKLY
jgi:hypothetical protein